MLNELGWWLFSSNRTDFRPGYGTDHPDPPADSALEVWKFRVRMEDDVTFKQGSQAIKTVP